MTLVVWPLSERPEFTIALLQLAPKVWPYFILEADASREHYSALFEYFMDYQFVVCDQQEQVIAGGGTIPVAWDGTMDGLPEGWDGALIQGVADRRAGHAPSALSAVSATIHPAYQGLGLGQLIIRTMKALGLSHGLSHLICPVRPSQKSRYPLIPLEQYIRWKQSDGAPFDPWMRTHWRLGAEFLRIEPASMVVNGTVAEWEDWTEMRFPESGTYVVPGALVPISIDCEQNLGRYIEPNAWMRYRLSQESEDAAELLSLLSRRL